MNPEIRVPIGFHKIPSNAQHFLLCHCTTCFGPKTIFKCFHLHPCMLCAWLALLIYASVNPQDTRLHESPISRSETVSCIQTEGWMHTAILMCFQREANGSTDGTLRYKQIWTVEEICLHSIRAIPCTGRKRGNFVQCWKPKIGRCCYVGGLQNFGYPWPTQYGLQELEHTNWRFTLFSVRQRGSIKGIH
jgi:hypothetical protein